MRKVSPLLPLLLILALAGCSSEDLPSDPSPASSAAASGESSAVSSEVSISGAPSAETSDTPQTITIDGYTVRFPSGQFYHWLDRDYSGIHVEDMDGEDITPIAIDLWYCANSIYNVDSTAMFTIGESASFREYTVPQSLELINYNAVVENVFTKNGIAQLEQTAFVSPGNLLIRKVDGKIYRIDGYKTGFDIADTLVDMQTIDRSEDRITLSVEYLVKGFIDDPSEEGYTEPVHHTVDFTIALEDGQWRVDDYRYPEAIASSETPPAAPTYADYFAEEYRFDAQPTNPEEPDAYVFLFSEEDEQNGITGFEQGYLYKTRLDDLYNPETTTLFYPEKVAAFARVKEHILACIGNEIIRLNYDGKEEGTMLTADSAITDIRASELLIFYVAGDRMYRFFTPTQTTDLMGEVAGIDSFTVYSNYRLQWRKPNPDWCGDLDCIEHPMSLTYILYANPLDPPPQTYPADRISGGELEEWLFALPTSPGV